MDTKEFTKQEEEKIALCAAAYFGTIMEVSRLFTASSEQILANPGYRDRDWAKALTKAIAPLGESSSEFRKFRAFAAPEMDAILDREAVAVLCLVDNILTTLYHEYIVYEQYERLARQQEKTKDERALMRRLRIIETKFRKLKGKFLTIACNGRPDERTRMYFDAHMVDTVKRGLYDAFLAAPVVYRYCKRHLTTDYSKITQLRTKYRQEIILCEQWRSEREGMSLRELGLKFEIKENGKF